MSTPTSQARKHRVLIVEDDLDIQVLLRVLLTRQGLEVSSADSGVTALAALAESLPDLILLDMAMPDMDGLTFLQRRSQILAYRDIPVIVVSARDRNTDVMAALEMGADHYVTKPFDNAKLLASILRLLPPNQPSTASARQSG